MPALFLLVFEAAKRSSAAGLLFTRFMYGAHIPSGYLFFA
ncbi:hypothetical protein HMPREF9413_3425 [Paenibacillus sp. HGF7]|nr:hypothetical protein HMPREF9413_3425 [Paenibacillus sp. HGF7]